ncbi:hypothetical protein GF367_03815 [Candidatus Woesearchaeota archaeon]|nr:hypothetical protein [Candidatus Woesearchaeota archaeon]
MQKRGALFYIIDAFVAASIIALTLTIIFLSEINVPETGASREALADFTQFLEGTSIVNLPTPTAADLYENDLLANQDASIMQAIIELDAEGDAATATQLLQEAAQKTLPAQYGFNFSIIKQGGTTNVYERNEEREPKARTSLTFQRPTFYFQDARHTFTIASIGTGETGDDACAPSTCIYVVDPAGPSYEDDGCDDTHNGWEARCLSYNESLMVTGMVEVSIWS